MVLLYGVLLSFITIFNTSTATEKLIDTQSSKSNLLCEKTDKKSDSHASAASSSSAADSKNISANSSYVIPPFHLIGRDSPRAAGSDGDLKQQSADEDYSQLPLRDLMHILNTTYSSETVRGQHLVDQLNKKQLVWNATGKTIISSLRSSNGSFEIPADNTLHELAASYCSFKCHLKGSQDAILIPELWGNPSIIVVKTSPHNLSGISYDHVSQENFERYHLTDRDRLDMQLVMHMRKIPVDKTALLATVAQVAEKRDLDKLLG